MRALGRTVHPAGAAIAAGGPWLDPVGLWELELAVGCAMEPWPDSKSGGEPELNPS